MAVNYLFPPNEINNLPTWRFIFHFIAPGNYNEALRYEVIKKLKNADFEIITFLISLKVKVYLS